MELKDLFTLFPEDEKIFLYDKQKERLFEGDVCKLTQECKCYLNRKVYEVQAGFHCQMIILDKESEQNAGLQREK